MSGSAPSFAVPSAHGLHVVVVASRFHESIVDALVEGAVGALVDAGAARDRVEVIRVPGAWEVPLVVDAALARVEVDGAVALGCLVRGDTAHFQLLAEESTRGLGRAMARFGKPVGHGILACENLEQAVVRSRPDASNKGREAALAVVATAEVLRQQRTAGSVA